MKTVHTKDGTASADVTVVSEQSLIRRNRAFADWCTSELRAGRLTDDDMLGIPRPMIRTARVRLKV